MHLILENIDYGIWDTWVRCFNGIGLGWNSTILYESYKSREKGPYSILSSNILLQYLPTPYNLIVNLFLLSAFRAMNKVKIRNLTKIKRIKIK